MIRSIVILLLLTACDFSSRLRHELIEIQGLISEQKYEKAVSQYNKILERSIPKELKLAIHFQLGQLYNLHLNEQNKAVLNFESIIKLTDDPLWLVKAYEKIGDISFTFLRNYPKAASIYTKLIEFKPKLESFDFFELRLGECYLKNRQFVLAKKIFGQLSKNKKHTYHVKSFYYLGLINYHDNNFEQAIDLWKEYIKREDNAPKIVETKFLIANTYETLEKLKDAYNIYYSILGDYPNPDVIKNRLESIYKRRIDRKR